MPGSLANSSISLPIDCVTWLIRSVPSVSFGLSAFFAGWSVDDRDNLGVEQLRGLANQRISKQFLLPLAAIDRRLGGRPFGGSGGRRIFGQRCEVEPNIAAGNLGKRLLQLLPPLWPLAILLRLSIGFS